MKQWIISLLLSAMVLPLGSQNLEIWIMPNGATPAELLDARLTEFKAKHNVEVDISVLDWGVAFTRISEALASGQGPHVLQLGTTWGPYFADQGYLTDLTPYAESLDLERFNPATLRTCQVAGDDRYFLVPWFSETRLIYTNKKYMDSVQASPEALLSYSGFMEYLQSIKAADLQVGEELVDPYGLPGLNDWNVLHNFAPWVWSFGGSFIIEENGQWRSGLLEPATVKGIFSYMHIVLSDLHAPEAIKENTSIVEMQFGTGQFAVFANTTNLIRNMELDSLSGGYSDRILAQDGLYATPFPSGPEGSVPFLGGSNLTIPATHKDNALALELIKTLTTTEQIDHYSRSVGFVPPDTTNWDLWGSKPFYDAAIASLRNARAYPNIPQWGEVEGLLVSTFAEIWTMLDSQFYSPTNYYRILNDYHFKVNQVLGYKSPDQKILSPEQFAVIIQDFREELESGVPVGTVEEPQEGPWYLWALGIGGGALLLAILFLLGKRGGSKA